MARKRRRSIMDLPLSDQTWHVAVRRLRSKIYIEDEDRFLRPYLVIIIDHDSEFILISEILLETAEAEDIHDLLMRIMKKPLKKVSIKPHRPKRIVCEEKAWVMELRSFMRPYSINVSFGSPPAIVDEFVEDLNDHMRKDAPGPPGLLSVEGVTPDLLADFFETTAELWRTAPWIWFNNRQILSMQIEDGQDLWFVQFMGYGGSEYGFILYQNWQDILRPPANSVPLSEWLPASGWHSLTYVNYDDLPLEDQDTINEFEWTIEDEMFSPFPAIFTADMVQRPPREELILMEAIMRAASVFTQQHLHPDGWGDCDVVEAKVRQSIMLQRI